MDYKDVSTGSKKPVVPMFTAKTRICVVIALIYLISPIDLIPGFLLDDTVVAIVLSVIGGLPQILIYKIKKRLKQ